MIKAALTTAIAIHLTAFANDSPPPRPLELYEQKLTKYKFTITNPFTKKPKEWIKNAYFHNPKDIFAGTEETPYTKKPENWAEEIIITDESENLKQAQKQGIEYKPKLISYKIGGLIELDNKLLAITYQEKSQERTINKAIFIKKEGEKFKYHRYFPAYKDNTNLETEQLILTTGGGVNGKKLPPKIEATEAQ